jgi:hypothetical protein
MSLYDKYSAHKTEAALPARPITFRAAPGSRPAHDGALVSLLFFHAGGAHAPHKIAIREAP